MTRSDESAGEETSQPQRHKENHLGEILRGFVSSWLRFKQIRKATSTNHALAGISAHGLRRQEWSRMAFATSPASGNRPSERFE
jgi:hypothetical protein